MLSMVLALSSNCIAKESYSALVNQLETELEHGKYKLNADITYNLSPSAKEALQKGVSLTWLVTIKVEQLGVLWNTSIQTIELSYQIKNHALLNQYSVTSNNNSVDMFSTLTGALNAMSKLRKLPIVDKRLLEAEQQYQVAIKVLFKREALPVPLRPLSYFDPQWALSSHWTLWQLQK